MAREPGKRPHNTRREHHGPAVNIQLRRSEELVMGAMAETMSPMSAYEILDMQRPGGLRAPAQVYRALKRLVNMGFVHRIESLNAFFLCDFPGAGGSHPLTAFIICNECGETKEAADKTGGLHHRLKEISKDMDFEIEETVLELYGLCEDCRETAKG